MTYQLLKVPYDYIMGACTWRTFLDKKERLCQSDISLWAIMTNANPGTSMLLEHISHIVHAFMWTGVLIRLNLPVKREKMMHDLIVWFVIHVVIWSDVVSWSQQEEKKDQIAMLDGRCGSDMMCGAEEEKELCHTNYAKRSMLGYCYPSTSATIDKPMDETVSESLSSR